MNPCTYKSWVGPYYDGELTPARSTELQSHLRTCSECAQELDALRTLSRAISARPAPTIPPAVVMRLHDHVGSLTDRSVRRFAELLSGLAAAVLIMSSAWLLRSTDVSADPLPPWEDAAQTLQSRLGPQPPSVHAAQWIVTQLQPAKAHE